jgi:hypothetical protein
VRIIKLALISAAIFFLIATAFSLLIPSHVRISKAINVRAEKTDVMSLVKEQQRWKEWHPAFMPNDSVQIPPIQILNSQVTDSSIIMELQQEKRQKVVNGFNFYEHPGVDSITVQWYMDFQLKWYPWRKFGSLFYESTYGTMMQEGLQNLKNLSDR